MASDWADEKAAYIAKQQGYADDADLMEAIAAALDIPGDCVRRGSDGAVVKVLGTLPMTADGCIIGTNADLYSWGVPQYTDDEGICRHTLTGPIVSAPHQCYSTRAAAEAARGEGSNG